MRSPGAPGAPPRGVASARDRAAGLGGRATRFARRGGVGGTARAKDVDAEAPLTARDAQSGVADEVIARAALKTR